MHVIKNEEILGKTKKLLDMAINIRKRIVYYSTMRMHYYDNPINKND
jgi:hypothetical protein